MNSQTEVVITQDEDVEDFRILALRQRVNELEQKIEELNFTISSIHDKFYDC